MLNNILIDGDRRERTPGDGGRGAEGVGGLEPEEREESPVRGEM